MALSLGAEGVSNLEAGQWEASVNYRFLSSNDGYIGHTVDPNYPKTIGAKIDIHSVDVQVTYAFTSRFSATLTLPFVYGRLSSLIEHNGVRHTTSAGGVGDMRLVGNAWLFDPATHTEGNISVGCGVKFPTGDENATDTFYKATGPEVRPVDIAIQPGDGGWGLVLETVGYQKIYKLLYGYAAGFYLLNPREQNSAYTPIPVYGMFRNHSVPDQYLGRFGLSYTVWEEQALSLSLGPRIDGIPRRDLVGGNEGFRRPGYALTIEPGVSWSPVFSWIPGRNTFNLFVPALVYANREKNIYDVRYNGHGPGAFADWVLIASITHQF